MLETSHPEETEPSKIINIIKVSSQSKLTPINVPFKQLNALTCQQLLQFLDTFKEPQKATISSNTSVHPSVYMKQLSTHWMDFMKFDIQGFFTNLSRIFKFH